MFSTSVDNLLREIASFMDRNPQLTSQMKDRIQALQVELGFLKMFIWLLHKNSLAKPYVRAAAAVGKRKLRLNDNFSLSHDRAVSMWLREIEVFRTGKIRGDCLLLFDFSSQYKFSSSSELLQFIRCTISNLQSLVRFKADAIVSAKMQFKALIKKLRSLRDFVRKTEQWLLCSFDIRDWAFKVACLSTLYWIDHMEEAMASQMNAVLCELLEMVKSFSPEVVGLFLLNVSELSSYDRFQTGEVIESFVNFILPVGFMKVLQVEVTFLMAFLMDPSQSEKDAKGGNLFFTKVKAIAGEIPSLICSLTAGESNESTVKERNVLLGNFQERTGNLMAEVRKLYIKNPHSSTADFPIINTLGFLDLILEDFGDLMDTLKTMVTYIPLAKDQLVTLQKELVSLRPFLKEVQQLQNQLDQKLNDLWMQINDAVYRAACGIFSYNLSKFPLCYIVIWFSDLMDQMKFIKREIRETMQKQTWKKAVLNAEVNSGNIHLNQANTLRPNEVVVGNEVLVGFKVEEETIINRLTRGSMKLDIVSIVGMPGIGKTTLAKKVYNSPLVRCHFHKSGWCFVSQVFETKMLLLDILRDTGTMLDDKIHYLSKEDLSDKLRKCLKGQRYLIIMDDIWDITAWDALKESFPDDNNGSRILLTSRNNFGCNPLLLHPLSKVESLELLMHKLFFKEGWPSNLSDHLKKIVKVCKGLPLAVVIVAGFLNRVSNNLDLWGFTVENLDLKVASEGCADIIELSYNHLPDFLKPCFLYLGALGEEKVFEVRKLIQLWIAEGFVQKCGIKSLEDVAMEYLEDLIGRSLVIVNERSFASGKPKKCRIHDLLREFCWRKVEEDWFKYFSEYTSHIWNPINYEQYRIGLHEWLIKSWSRKASPIFRSLVLHQVKFSAYLQSDFFSSLKFVRALDLGNSHFRDYFPEEIASLMFLRYLAIWCDVEVIPSSIGKLRNLECFHVARSFRDITELPQTIWKIKSLRKIAVVGGRAVVVNNCDANMCAQLDNLHSFSTLYLCNVEEAEKLLRGFPNVRKLKLVFSESWDCRRNCDQFQVFHFLSKLESLNLHFSQRVAHTCGFNFPEALKKLTLCKLDCSSNQISTIGKLPNLEVLKLFSSAIVGKRWDVGDEEFLKLKYLKLSGLEISHWESFDSSFPCLERLVVKNCRFLVELPSIFVDAITLKMIEIFLCPVSLGTSAKSILYEQRAIGNEDLEVLISEELDDEKEEYYLLIPKDLMTLYGANFFCQDVPEHIELDEQGIIWQSLRLFCPSTAQFFSVKIDKNIFNGIERCAEISS